MTRKAAEPILDCEGAMGEVFPGVFKTRIPPLMYIHREHRVWMIVTTHLKLSPLDLIQRESFFKHATEGESVEFLWKASGPFDMAIRQFRLDFLRHLSDEILSAQIKLAIYLEADVIAGQQASQQASMALASSLARAVEAAGHESAVSPAYQDVPQAIQSARVIDASRSPLYKAEPFNSVEPDAVPPRVEAETPLTPSAIKFSAETVELSAEPEADAGNAHIEPLSADEATSVIEPEVAADQQDILESSAPEADSQLEVEPDAPQEVVWHSPQAPDPMPSWAEPPWPDSPVKAADVPASTPIVEAPEPEQTLAIQSHADDVVANSVEGPVVAEFTPQPVIQPVDPLEPLPISKPALEQVIEPTPVAHALRVPLGEKSRPPAEAIEDLLPGNFYQDYYGFEHMPFNNTPDSFFFFPTEKHQEALSRLIYAISERKGFVVISGEIGAGKTTLCRTLLTQLPRAVKIALITHTHLDSDQLIRAIAEDLDIQTEGLDRREIIARLNQFLIEQLAANCTVCIIIDEAQNLSPMVLEEVRMISNLETEQEKLVQLILLGQPELRDKLKDPTLKQLRQRIAVQYHLAPLNLEETISYISHRLKVAAPASELHFNRAAMQEVFQYSGGVPRLINTLCDNALLTCFTRNQRKVTPKIVREAARDLALEPQEVGFWQMWKFW